MASGTASFVHEAGAAGAPATRSRGGPGHLFVHGAVATGLMWREHLDRFSGQFQCLAPDLPGLGRSKGVAFVSRAVTADLIAELVVTGVPARWAHVVSLSSGVG
jgi:pimeloyl-ACP methyl ester carboxylesterase